MRKGRKEVKVRDGGGKRPGRKEGRSEGGGKGVEDRKVKGHRRERQDGERGGKNGGAGEASGRQGERGKEEIREAGREERLGGREGIGETMVERGETVASSKGIVEGVVKGMWLIASRVGGRGVGRFGEGLREADAEVRQEGTGVEGEGAD